LTLPLQNKITKVQFVHHPLLIYYHTFVKTTQI
jgi:hypothetical protein